MPAGQEKEWESLNTRDSELYYDIGLIIIYVYCVARFRKWEMTVYWVHE
jgi:hypothetical protein